MVFFGDWSGHRLVDGVYNMLLIENTKANGEIMVSIMSDQGLPFTVIKDNQLVGSDIGLAKRFDAILQEDVEFSDVEFGSVIAAVSTNKVDMIISTMMITEEREKQNNFSDPNFELSTCVMGTKKESAGARETSSFFQHISDSIYNNIKVENRYLIILDGTKKSGVISVLSVDCKGDVVFWILRLLLLPGATEYKTERKTI